MSELANFPFINQLDGTENAQFNCVPASICAGLQYLTGKVYKPDALKDLAYGPTWANNGTSAHAYATYVGEQGVHFYTASGSPDQLIQRAHQEIKAGHPVIFTQVDDYAPAQYRDIWTHVCIWYREDGGSLTAMDPYGAKAVMFTDQVWASRLRASEIWIMEGAAIMIDLSRVARWYEQAPGNMWKCLKNGKVVGNAILDFYRKFGNDQLCGLTYLGLPLTNEQSIGNGRTIQRFERGVLAYDPNHTNDQPPGAGVVYMVKIYEGVGLDPGIPALQQQLANVQKQATQQIADLQQQLAQAKATQPASPAPTGNDKNLQALLEIDRIVSQTLGG